MSPLAPLARLAARLRRTGRSRSAKTQPDAAQPDDDQPSAGEEPGMEHDAPQQDQVPPERAPGPDDDDRPAFPGEFSGYPHVGAKPPSYPAQPSAARDAREDLAGALIPDSVVDGFAVGTLTVRGASVAGDAHRYDGSPRQDAMATLLLGPPEGGLILAVVADGVGSEPCSHVGAAAACRATAAALAARAGAVETALRAAQLDRLYFEVVHVIDEATARVETEAARLSRPPRELATTLRAVLVPTDREVRTRLAFSVGDGGTLRLADAAWSPVWPAPGQDSGLHDTSTAVLPLHPEEVRLATWTAAAGEAVIVCTDGFSEPLRDTQFAELLAKEWTGDPRPGTMRFLWQAQARLRSYDDDRTVACIWEAVPMSPAESPAETTSS
jgi:serine/threonine protein phosphatase PrpC